MPPKQDLDVYVFMTEHYSNKIQNAIQKELFKAKSSIRIAVAWFTNDLLFQPILLKLGAGVHVEIILNKDEINCSENNEVNFDEFVKAGGVLRWNDTKKLLHDKFCIIDEDIVIYGSYNWTNKAEYNEESIAISRGESSTAQFYLEKFLKLTQKYPKEEKPESEHTENSVSDDASNEDGRDVDEYFVDEYGAKYSKDRKRLIKVPGDEWQIKYINRPAELYISGKCPTSYHIPDGITAIEDYAFAVCASLKSIYIPNSVTSIGKGTFSSCCALTSIHIPDSVTSIGDFAFSGCSSLKSIRLPNSLTSIGVNTFYGCRSIVSIHIPDSVVTIGEAAFWGCRNLTSIHLPDGVTRIEKCAFFLCEKLSSVEIPDSVNYIGDSAFCRCESLISLHIPYSIKSIEKELFSFCRKLKHIIIPNNVTSIGEKAFWFSDIQSVIFPDSITSIGEGAFGNTLLDTIYIPVGTKSKFEKMLPGWIGWKWNRLDKKCVVEYYTIEDVFKIVSNSDLENAWTDEYGVKYSIDRKRLLKATELGMSNYSIKNGTKVICNKAFFSCGNLKSIYIPDSVVCIGDCAFMGCQNLGNIRISANVTNIGNLAFSCCKSISFIKIPNIIRIGLRAFSKCDNLISIQIPTGCKRKFEDLLPEYKDKLVEEV